MICVLTVLHFGSRFKHGCKQARCPDSIGHVTTTKALVNRCHGISNNRIPRKLEDFHLRKRYNINSSFFFAAIYRRDIMTLAMLSITGCFSYIFFLTE